MKKPLLTLSWCVLLVGASVCCAQTTPKPAVQDQTKAVVEPPPPPKPLAPERRVGRAEVFYHRPYGNHQESSSVRTSLNVFEKRRDKGIDEYLTLYAYFRVSGKRAVKPNGIVVEFVSYTRDSPKAKFEDEGDRKLAIIVDGRQLGSSTLKRGTITNWSPTSRTESVGSIFDYQSFAEIAAAKQVKLQLGSIEINLTEDKLEGFRDLLKAIE